MEKINGVNNREKFRLRVYTDNPYILVVSCQGYRSENNAMEYINKYVKKYVVKSKTVSVGSNIELQ